VEQALEKAGITVNKNAVPNDPLPPTKTSGIRLGTSALTTRGMKEDDMRQIARWIDTVIKNLDDEKVIERVRNEVREMCDRYPLYPEWREKAHKLLRGESV
jgi:glycine hydroxymethyltransferase